MNINKNPLIPNLTKTVPFPWTALLLAIAVAFPVILAGQKRCLFPPVDRGSLNKIKGKPWENPRKMVVEWDFI